MTNRTIEITNRDGEAIVDHKAWKRLASLGGDRWNKQISTRDSPA